MDRIEWNQRNEQQEKKQNKYIELKIKAVCEVDRLSIDVCTANYFNIFELRRFSKEIATMLLLPFDFAIDENNNSKPHCVKHTTCIVVAIPCAWAYQFILVFYSISQIIFIN